MKLFSILLIWVLIGQLSFWFAWARMKVELDFQDFITNSFQAALLGPIALILVLRKFL